MSHDRVFTKCAWRLIPFMVLLFVINFIDRTNVGIAALTMNTDLGFSPEVFGFGAGVLFVGYGLFQIPSNLILERVGARRWIFCILASWGLLSTVSALVAGPLSFYAVRFLLGIAEAGLFPGMIFYLGLWFPKSYQARFVASFASAIPLSGIIGGPLGGLILQMDGVAGLHGWQWLFVIEGLPASLMAFAVLRWMPDGPASASWLGPVEKQIILSRLAAEAAPVPRNFSQAFVDTRVWMLGLLCNLQITIALYGITLWLPQIVQDFGFSNLTTGFIVPLPYAAAIILMVLWGRSSDRKGERVRHIAAAALLAAAGFLCAAIGQNNALVLIGLTTAFAGVMSVYGPFWSLPTLFLRGAGAAAGIALINTLAALGGFVGPALIGIIKERTGDYTPAMLIIAIGQLVGALVVLWFGRVLTHPQVLPPKETSAAA